MSEERPDAQHNSGSGTFVAGNVEGGIHNVYYVSGGAPEASEPEAPTDIDPASSDAGGTDPDSPASALAGAVCAAFLCGTGIVNCLGIVPDPYLNSHELSTKATAVPLFIWVVMSLAAGLARTAQILSVWAQRAAEGAVASLPSHPGAAGASATNAALTASLSRVCATGAIGIATLFSWFSFGRSVTDRARQAHADGVAAAERAERAARGS